MDLLISGDLKGIIDVLVFMEESEKKIADFYHACGEMFPGHQAFWFGIESQEHKHVIFIQKMKQIIEKKPENFEKGRPFNIMAAKTIIAGINSNTTKVKTGQLKMINALSLARDNEQSFIESKYNEIVKTDDIQYMTLVNEIVTETNKHRQEIDTMIALLKSQA
ncbi:MAG: hypothetical protein ABFD12_05945 [Syntrophorhabdus sp.]